MSDPNHQTAYQRTDAGPRLCARHPLARLHEDWPGMRTRWIVEPDESGWSDFALAEWELTSAGWSDLHPHDELNVVLDGKLHVETQGSVVVLGPGDAVRVPAGEIGTYWAPRYARMLSVYGPNATGAESEYVKYWDIDPTDTSASFRANERNNSGE